MSIFDWLPAPPWLGPPLPRFLGIVWPWTVQEQESLPALPLPKQYVTGASAAPLASYQNEETWEIEWSDDLPTKIIVHRHAERQ